MLGIGTAVACRRNAPGGARANGRRRCSHHETDARLNRPDHECDGAHRPRRLPLAHFLYPGDHGRHRALNVDRHRGGVAALPGNRRVLRGNGEALPRHGKLVLLRGTILSESRNRVALCPAFEIYCGLGLASLLLDLSRGDGRGHGHPVRLPGRNPLAELHERIAASAAPRRSTSRST